MRIRILIGIGALVVAGSIAALATAEANAGSQSAGIPIVAAVATSNPAIDSVIAPPGPADTAVISAADAEAQCTAAGLVCPDLKPDSITLARWTNTAPGAVGEATPSVLAWVMTWNHATNCVPKLGRAPESGAPVAAPSTPATCFVQAVVNATTGAGIETSQIG